MSTFCWNFIEYGETTELFIYHYEGYLIFDVTRSTIIFLTYAITNRYNREYISVDSLWNFVRRHPVPQVPLIHVWVVLIVVA